MSASGRGAARAGLHFNIQIAHAQGNARVGSAALLLGIIMLRRHNYSQYSMYGLCEGWEKKEVKE